MKGPCARCGKRRPLRIVTGPGLHEKGVELCRPCTQGYKLALKLKVNHDLGKELLRNADQRP